MHDMQRIAEAARRMANAGWDGLDGVHPSSHGMALIEWAKTTGMDEPRDDDAMADFADWAEDEAEAWEAE